MELTKKQIQDLMPHWGYSGERKGFYIGIDDAFLSFEKAQETVQLILNHKRVEEIEAIPATAETFEI